MVTYREFLAMREGASNPQVRAQAKRMFDAADVDGDEVLSLDEFIAAAQQRAGDPPREGDRPRGAPDVEGQRRGPRDGERDQPGPRDGDAPARDRD
jgi:hypothetical protein